MRMTWLRFGILTTLVALAIVSVLLSRRANEVSRERKALVRLGQDQIEPRIEGMPNEAEPVKEFLSGGGVTDVEFIREAGELGEIEPEQLESLGDLPHLELLSIYSFDLDWPHVDAIPTLPTVREFNWRPDEPGRYDGEMLLELVGKMPNVERLYAGVQASDRDVEAAIGMLPKLRELTVESDRVGGDFIDALQNRRVESLTILGDDVTPDGFARLANVPSLRDVEISGTHFPLETLEALSALDHIEELWFHLEPGPIPEETLDSFNSDGNERFERGGKEFFQRLWPESSTEIGGDGWFYHRCPAMK